MHPGLLIDRPHWGGYWSGVVLITARYDRLCVWVEICLRVSNGRGRLLTILSTLVIG